jgi:radical SAM superfamily enzyme YgiQ (UPF0313 family)
MDIALINIKENYIPVPPLGILYIGTLLKQHGYTLSVFDVNFKNADALVKRLKRLNPMVVGFSVMTTNYKITQLVNRSLQAELPHTYFCWGGIHPTVLPEKTMSDNDLDFLVYGEGEFTMLEVLQKTNRRKVTRGIDLEGVNGVYYYKHGNIVKNPPRPLISDIDQLPFPDRTLIENFNSYLAPPGIIRLQFIKGTTPVMASRGCPYSCIFCSSHKIHGNLPRVRRPEKVIDEIECLRDKHGIKGVMFWDDTFGISKKWVKSFCQEYIRRKPGVVWGCQTRANIVQHYEIIDMMKQAGCVQVDIGVESGSNKILRILKKGTNVDMIKQSFDNLKKLRINSFTTYIIGNPEETAEDIQMTYEIAKLAPRGGVSFLILSPFPGSRLFKMAKKNNWLVADYENFDERWTNKESDKPVMTINRAAKEIVSIRNQLQNRFEIKNILVILRSFLFTPKCLAILLFIALIHPEYLFRAIKKKKIKEWMESVYQNFNGKLQNHTWAREDASFSTTSPRDGKPNTVGILKRFRFRKTGRQ